MATLAIVLRTSKKLSGDEYAVMFRITHQRHSKYYAVSMLVTNQSFKWRCTQKDWKPATIEDNGLGRFRKNVPNYKELNAILEDKLQDAQQLLTRYDKEGILFSFEQFELDLKHKDKPVITSLHDYYSQQLRLLHEQERVGLAGLYKENQRILKQFKPNALLADVNVRFLESFEYWLRNKRNNKDTTISVKMRNLQRIINQAIEDKLFTKEDYPFGEKKYSVNKRLDHTTKKIAITTDKITKLKILTLEPGSALHLAQQMFLFSYYTRGMNFIDMTFLKWEQISNTHIDYKRTKTRGLFHIPRNSQANEILAYFKANYQSKDGFVFPILDLSIHITKQQQYTRKKTALKAINDNLKKLAEMIGEKGLKLTTNVGRHSYATGLKRSGANTSYITEALGHATEMQTQTYLAEFETGIIEVWESKLFDVK